LHQTNLNR